MWLEKLFYKKADALLPLEEILPDQVVQSSRTLPLIFGLCFGCYPMYHTREYGWGFLVPALSHSDVPSERIFNRDRVMLPTKLVFSFCL
jgi:hypothetical protein